jgi:hypothetical protein
VLADVAGMARSALLPIYWEAQAHSHLPALLCWGASVFDGICEPLEFSLILALAYLSMCSRTISRFKTSLAPATHEKARIFVRVKLIAPLMLARLFGRVPLPFPALGQTSESEW